MTRLLILFLAFLAAGIVQKKAICQPTGIELPAGIDLLNPGANPFKDRPWELVFVDDFNNLTGVPDPGKWSVNNNFVEPVGSADCIYRSQNISVQGGRCIMEIRKETTPYTHNGVSYNYSASDMSAWPVSASDGMMFQASIKMPKGEYYTHSNFWTIGDYIKDGGEIDAAEINGNHNGYEMPATVHYFDLCPRVDRHCGGPLVRIGNTPAAVTDMFYTYSFIWDKYFIYFYVSADNISHQLVRVIPRLLYSSTNNLATAVPYLPPSYSPSSPMPANYTTISGYYWLNDCFKFFNNTSRLGLHTFLNPNNNIVQFGAGLPAQMEVEWVKVYKRKPCNLEETITSSELFPFFDIKAKEINLGTSAAGSTQNIYQWKNIAKRWSIPNDYEAQSIILHPGFISKAEYIDGNFCDGVTSLRPSVASYIAKSCAMEITNEYEEDEYDTDYLNMDTAAISWCEYIDTAWVDSAINAHLIVGDTFSADSIISFIVDSLGCEYWGYGEGGENKPGKRGSSSSSRAIQYLTAKGKNHIDNIRIYPNPTTGSFNIEIPQRGNYTIRVMNMLGSTVYEGKMADEQKKSIILDNNLPPGNYTLHISGDGLRHVERITLTK